MLDRPAAGRPAKDEPRDPTRRTNLSLRPDALERIDAEAERLGLTRSAFMEAIADPEQRPAILAALAALEGPG